ncbi:MAG TPA: transaldolase family protein [Pseudothermotoga sp.]|nr:transaldolase family protein [Pseudothermotoga sp.]HOK82997.1 transaldolase family protein [Pseudothermotoga sp.]HPP69834.1 transaldolase family protein [Pseudothermotoga sp.]
MKVYIDSCNEEALSLAEGIGIGITTNPSIVLRDRYGDNLLGLIQRLANSRIPTIFFQIENLEEEIMKHLDPKRFIIKIPWVVEKYSLATLLKEKGFRVCATATYEISQLVFALNFDVDYVAFYFDRAERRGIDPRQRLSYFKQVIDNSRENTKLIVASLKTVQQVIEAIDCGADEVAVPFDVFKEFVKVPEYVEQDVRRFSEDFRKILSASSVCDGRTCR